MDNSKIDTRGKQWLWVSAVAAGINSVILCRIPIIFSGGDVWLYEAILLTGFVVSFIAIFKQRRWFRVLSIVLSLVCFASLAIFTLAILAFTLGWLKLSHQF